MGCGMLLINNTDGCTDPRSHPSLVTQCAFRGCNPCSPVQARDWAGDSWLPAPSPQPAGWWLQEG